MKVRFIAVICILLLSGSAMWSNNSILSMQSVVRAQADFSCDNVSEIPQSECEALVAIYKVSPNAGWEGWLATNTPCSWGNVTCSDSHVTKLYLADKQLTNLPAEIANLTSLMTLNLGENYLQNLPSQIGDLSSLTELYLYRNSLNGLPAEIGRLASLDKLILARNSLVNLPPEVGSLTSLSTLDLTENMLTDLPVEIGGLTSLNALSLDRNQLASLPIEIGLLSSLTTLSLSDNNLASLPSEIGGLSSLTDLYLSNNVLTSLPPEIGNLTALENLYLMDDEFQPGYNELTSLPSTIGNLSSLKKLYLNGAGLATLPAEIGNLTSLEKLYLNDNELTSLPSDLLNLDSLEELSLSNNLLTNLPSTIGTLTTLVTLRLDRNNLAEVPAEIGNLTSLVTLELSENDIESLPEEIGNLSSLLFLSVIGNPLPSLPVNVNISNQGLGDVDRSMPGPFYVEGTILKLSAIPEDGWLFEAWAGPQRSNAEASSQTKLVTIGQIDESFTAYFTQYARIAGDVNCDNELDTNDVQRILEYSAGLLDDSGECQTRLAGTGLLNVEMGDVNGNGITNSSDALLILRCVMGFSNVLCPTVTAAGEMSAGDIAALEEIKQMLSNDAGTTQQTEAVLLPFLMK